MHHPGTGGKPFTICSVEASTWTPDLLRRQRRHANYNEIARVIHTYVLHPLRTWCKRKGHHPPGRI